jgi:hypothetical protein
LGLGKYNRLSGSQLVCSSKMHFSICLYVLAFLSSTSIALPTTTSLKHCDTNNCYNAHTNSLSIATPFCSQYIRSTVTIVNTPVVTVSGTNTITPPPTAYPTIAALSTNSQLSSRCNQDTNAAGVPSTLLYLRLSSACSCLPIVPLTVTTTVNGPPTVRSIQPCLILTSHG